MVWLVVLVLAVAGHQRARWFQGRYGRTPWGWSPWPWAAAFGPSWVVGFVLLAIAERQGRAAAVSATTPPQLAPLTDPRSAGPVFPPPEGTFKPRTAARAGRRP